MTLNSINKIDFGHGYRFVESFSGPTEQLENEQFQFLRLCSVRYDEEMPRMEALENVLASITDPTFNLVYLLTGDNGKVSLYLGIMPDLNCSPSPARQFGADDYLDVLQSAFESNFPGSVFAKPDFAELSKTVVPCLKKLKRKALVTGIPTLHEDKNQIMFQGMERLANSMHDQVWALMIVARPVPPEDVWPNLEELFEIVDQISAHNNITTQETTQSGENKSFSDDSTHTASHSENTGWQKNNPDNTTNSNGSGKQEQTTKTTSNARSESKTTTRTVSHKNEKKQLVDLADFIEKCQIPRLKKGITTVMFDTQIIVAAESKQGLLKLSNCLMSVFQGNSSSYTRLRAWPFNLSNDRKLEKTVENFQQLRTSLNGNQYLPIILGHKLIDEKNTKWVQATTRMTAEELCLLAGLPQQDLPGIEVIQGVNFGLNTPEIGKNYLEIGQLMHRGKILQSIPVNLEKDSLQKHLFIAGATGYGKTTTCHKLLLEAKVPFMVIEPAKTEYRELLSQKLPGFTIFTLGNEALAPLRFNPFELPSGELPGPYIDMLKMAITAAFPMEAAMPQILEEAIYRLYSDYGWNIMTGKNRYHPDPWNAEGMFWPTFGELIGKILEVVHSKGFGKELGGNYSGALLARLNSFTIGSKGSMLNTRNSFDFDVLLERPVVIEMEDLPDPQDKALMMAFLLVRLRVALRKKYRENHGFRHVTLIEEAHRLLEKIEPGMSNSKKLAVSTFADMLAEVRKYGEGLIIVDQIPNKLASEVLKNTSTKIIHRIFAQDDKDAVGSAMNLENAQKNQLSALKVGEAVVFSEGWNKPVQVKILRYTDTGARPVIENELARQGDCQLEEALDRLMPVFSCKKFNQKLFGARKLINSVNEIFEELKILAGNNAEYSQIPQRIKRLTDECFGKIFEKNHLAQLLAMETLQRLPNSAPDPEKIAEKKLKYGEIWQAILDPGAEDFAEFVRRDKTTPIYLSELLKLNRFCSDK